MPMYLGWSGSSGLAHQPPPGPVTGPGGRGLLPVVRVRGGQRVAEPTEASAPGPDAGAVATTDTLALPLAVAGAGATPSPSAPYPETGARSSWDQAEPATGDVAARSSRAGARGHSRLPSLRARSRTAPARPEPRPAADLTPSGPAPEGTAAPRPTSPNGEGAVLTPVGSESAVAPAAATGLSARGMSDRGLSDRGLAGQGPSDGGLARGGAAVERASSAPRPAARDAGAGQERSPARVDSPAQVGRDGAQRAPTAGEVAGQVLVAADAFVGRLAELPVRQAGAYGRILRADLLFRLGREADAGRALDLVETTGDIDDATLAHVALVRGDWAGFPDGGAQTLRRRWDGSLIPTARPAYRDRAEELWRRSLAAYGRIGSDSGRAAGLLRLAEAPTATGRPILRRARIDEAARRARSAGNDALTWTARLHSLIERARTGEASTMELSTMMTALAEWSRFDGSTSYGQGLRQLLSAATGVTPPADDY